MIILKYQPCLRHPGQLHYTQNPIHRKADIILTDRNLFDHVRI